MTILLQIILILIGILFLALILRKFLIQFLNQEKATNLWWVTRPLDKLARKQNSCHVLKTIEDMKLDDCQIEIVEATCESGLPHTSNAHTIRMTENVWSSATRDTTLKHERVHILQRRCPGIWARFYREKWGYELHTSPPSSFPVKEMERIRSNPDTAAVAWAVWQNRYWIVPLYKNHEYPTLLGVSIQIWDAQQHMWVKEMPEEWRYFFCGDGKCPHQWEHPHEISAELWTADAFDTPAGYFLKEFMQTFMSSE